VAARIASIAGTPKSRTHTSSSRQVESAVEHQGDAAVGADSSTTPVSRSCANLCGSVGRRSGMSW
jgi:hypothetical protein